MTKKTYHNFLVIGIVALFVSMDSVAIAQQAQQAQQSGSGGILSKIGGMFGAGKKSAEQQNKSKASTTAVGIGSGLLGTAAGAAIGAVATNAIKNKQQEKELAQMQAMGMMPMQGGLGMAALPQQNTGIMGTITGLLGGNKKPTLAGNTSLTGMLGLSGQTTSPQQLQAVIQKLIMTLQTLMQKNQMLITQQQQQAMMSQTSSMMPQMNMGMTGMGQMNPMMGMGMNSGMNPMMGMGMNSGMNSMMNMPNMGHMNPMMATSGMKPSMMGHSTHSAIDPALFPCHKCNDPIFSQMSQGKCKTYCEARHKLQFAPQLSGVEKRTFKYGMNRPSMMDHGQMMRPQSGMGYGSHNQNYNSSQHMQGMNAPNNIQGMNAPHNMNSPPQMMNRPLMLEGPQMNTMGQSPQMMNRPHMLEGPQMHNQMNQPSGMPPSPTMNSSQQRFGSSSDDRLVGDSSDDVIMDSDTFITSVQLPSPRMNSYGSNSAASMGTQQGYSQSRSQQPMASGSHTPRRGQMPPQSNSMVSPGQTMSGQNMGMMAPGSMNQSQYPRSPRQHGVRNMPGMHNNMHHGMMAPRQPMPQQNFLPNPSYKDSYGMGMQGQMMPHNPMRQSINPNMTQQFGAPNSQYGQPFGVNQMSQGQQPYGGYGMQMQPGISYQQPYPNTMVKDPRYNNQRFPQSYGQPHTQPSSHYGQMNPQTNSNMYGQPYPQSYQNYPGGYGNQMMGQQGYPYGSQNQNMNQGQQIGGAIGGLLKGLTGKK